MSVAIAQASIRCRRTSYGAVRQGERFSIHSLFLPCANAAPDACASLIFCNGSHELPAANATALALHTGGLESPPVRADGGEGGIGRWEEQVACVGLWVLFIWAAYASFTAAQTRTPCVYAQAVVACWAYTSPVAAFKGQHCKPASYL